MTLFERFKQYAEHQCLINHRHKILIAVSGGIDSVCLLDLFSKYSTNIAIVHCNFQLRGKESDDEEEFVKNLANQYQLPIFVKRFDTLDYAQLQKLTIQEAARELRYSYFENIRRLYSYDFVATAHQANDHIETFFINLLRGTGIKGLVGIRPRNQSVVRPLLFAFRNEIEHYIEENHLTYRIDSSNNTDKYLRNQIRHHLIPLFQQLSPSFLQTMKNNLDRIGEAEKLYSIALEEIKSKLFTKVDQHVAEINIQELVNQPSPKVILFEILKEYGFKNELIDEIYSVLHKESGKQFFSTDYQLVKDRNKLIISKIEKKSSAQFFSIDEKMEKIDEPIGMIFKRYDAKNYEITKSSRIAALDYSKLEFPLILRRWQHGDYFQPLGFPHFKKLSDYFIDHKISIIEKEKIWILTSGEQIVWIVGHRIDDRFKITPQTQDVYEIQLID